MEDHEMMMMSIRNPDQITSSASWKLYENPFYYSHLKREEIHQNLLFSPSARQIKASFWDLTFIRAIMESELESAQAQIVELKAELEFERRGRRRLELMNKKLGKELIEERNGKETLKRVCEKLAREVSSEKCEIDEMKREIEEERKMLRVAEVLREERVQMKLAEAKSFLEDKLSEINKVEKREETQKQEEKSKIISRVSSTPSNLSERLFRLVMGDKTIDHKIEEQEQEQQQEKRTFCRVKSENRQFLQIGMQQRKSISEAENPHIKRGIKGFVEFPRVIRAIRSRSGNWGTKIECQKAQLKILLRQKSTPRSVNLVAG